jgi:hypothetical protein
VRSLGPDQSNRTLNAGIWPRVEGIGPLLQIPPPKMSWG